MNKLRRFELDLKALLLDVETEQTLYRNTLEQLLTGIVGNECMAEFLSVPGGDAWCDVDVESKLRNRLRGSFTIYVDNVRGMEESLNKLLEHLGSNKGKVRLLCSVLYADCLP